MRTKKLNLTKQQKDIIFKRITTPMPDNFLDGWIFLRIVNFDEMSQNPTSLNIRVCNILPFDFTDIPTKFFQYSRAFGLRHIKGIRKEPL